MKLSLSRRACAAALIVAVTATASTSAFADPQDYEFRLVEAEIKQGDGAVVAVQLIDRRSGTRVPDAVIFTTSIDMAPDGMAMMASPISALPTTDPGVYRFRTNLTMAGGWQLSLAARVQGETAPIEATLVLKAVK